MLLSIGLWFMLFLFLLDCNIPLLAVLHEPREQKKKRIMQVYLFEASVVEVYFLTSHVFTAWTPLDNENL